MELTLKQFRDFIFMGNVNFRTFIEVTRPMLIDMLSRYRVSMEVDDVGNVCEDMAELSMKLQTAFERAGKKDINMVCSNGTWYISTPRYTIVDQWDNVIVQRANMEMNPPVIFVKTDTYS